MLSDGVATALLGVAAGGVAIFVGDGVDRGDEEEGSVSINKVFK